MKDLLPKIAVVALYFLVIALGHKLDGGHIGLAALIFLLLVVHARTRSFFSVFFPMLLYLLCYDLVHFLPQTWRLPVHVAELYRWESALFGGLPHEFFLTHHWLAADLVAAITYSLHYIVPLAFGIFLWSRFPRHANAFAWAFFAMNIWALVTQLAFPTAPPWYVTKYGFAPADPMMSGDAAGLLRVDEWLGRPYFANMYRMSAIVYGAMPSMHGAWPVLLLCFRRRFPKAVVGALVFYTVLMWSSAVYLQHHYIIDLMAGAVMAIVSATVVIWIMRPSTVAECADCLPDPVSEAYGRRIAEG